MKIDILTIFPEMFDGFLSTSIIKRAIQKKLVDIQIHDIRKYSKDPHKRVDDYGFGGGRGMVLMPQPIFDAVEIQNTIRSIQKDTKIKGRKLYMPIRIATTREMHGPELAPSIELLGREKALKHLKQTLEEMN